MKTSPNGPPPAPPLHSSLLSADWLSTTLSGRASMTRDGRSAYTHTTRGEPICENVCVKRKRKPRRSYLQLGAHLGAGGAEVRGLEPLPESHLDALAMPARAPGRQGFVPRTRVLGGHPPPLDRAGLRAGVGPRTRRRDGPQLLKAPREGRVQRSINIT